MNRAQKLLLALLAVAAFVWWRWKQGVASAPAVAPATGLPGASTNLTLGADGKSNYSIGQIGATLVQQDTKGDALATAIGDLLGSGGAGNFKYVSPDFTIDASRLDIGSYTALKPVQSQIQIGKARSAGEDVVVMKSPAYWHGGAATPFFNVYVTVGGKKPTFDQKNPATFMILPADPLW